MKKCPYCAEEIQDEAIKCKHCGEFLDGYQRPQVPNQEIQKPQDEIPWYFKTSSIVVMLCCVGPLALPLIWWRPKTSTAWKVGLTIVILILSWFCYKMTVQSVNTIMDVYQQVLDM